jgi:peptidyl-prolyl cis-trans isomerase A (cyclophilin A)
MKTLLAAAIGVLLAWQPTPGRAPVRVLIETEAGVIELEIDLGHAPVTGANFLKYIDAGLYDGGRFHRTVTMANQPDNRVKIEVIQAAANAAREGEYLPAIPLERTSVTGLSHVDGTLSMARDGPDTARDEFFVCIGDQKALDFAGARNPDGQGFAAFGHVVRGMDVVRRIQGSPANRQALQPPIGILRARRI